jgi:hypothetical protein
VQLLRREEKLGGSMRSGFGSPQIGMVNVEVLKQYMISRIVRIGSKNIGEDSCVSSGSSASEGRFSEDIGERFCVLYRL